MNILARLNCKPFNIIKEQICNKGENDGYWYFDGKVYYGNRFGVFNESKQKIFTIYTCTDCKENNYKINNNEILVGYCDYCKHPLWNN